MSRFLRPKQDPPVRFSAPDDRVFALTNITKGMQTVAIKGKMYSRHDPVVQELPAEFEVRYRLSEEVNDGT